MVESRELEPWESLERLGEEGSEGTPMIFCPLCSTEELCEGRRFVAWSAGGVQHSGDHWVWDWQQANLYYDELTIFFCSSGVEFTITNKREL